MVVVCIILGSKNFPGSSFLSFGGKTLIFLKRFKNSFAFINLINLEFEIESIFCE